MGTLVLVRHGESRWNLDNRFTGWVDVPLSQNGIREAERVADFCQKFEYSAAFTSNLTRAQETLLIILARQDLTGVFQHSNDYRHPDWIRHSNQPSVRDIPVYVSAELNERYYGALQGLSKRVAEKKYGKDQVLAWRRGYEDRPPGGESLKETQARVQPYLTKHILPRVRLGESVIVAAHGNTLRAVIKNLEGISDEDIAYVDLPVARPLVYHYRRGKFVRVEGDYQLSRPLR
jgi:2,3-bisphosphoglycerate-dependent phosphoglycerate mutase